MAADTVASLVENLKKAQVLLFRGTPRHMFHTPLPLKHQEYLVLLSHPGALDLTITSSLNSTVLSEVSVRGRISCTGSLKAQAPS